MRACLFKYLTLVLVLTASMFGAYRYWLYEEPRAVGPLAERLLAAFDADEDKQILDELVNSQFEDEAPLTERRALLESNGFDCVIRPATVAGNEILSCRRPIEGRHYCDRFHVYAYQTAAGEIIESLTSTYRVQERDMVFGRCPYNPPSAQD